MTKPEPLDATFTLHIQQHAQQFSFTITDQRTQQKTQFRSLLKAFEYLEQQFRPSSPRSLR